MLTREEIERLAELAYPYRIEVYNDVPIDTNQKEREAFKSGVMLGLSVK